MTKHSSPGGRCGVAPKRGTALARNRGTSEAMRWCFPRLLALGCGAPPLRPRASWASPTRGQLRHCSSGAERGRASPVRLVPLSPLPPAFLPRLDFCKRRSATSRTPLCAQQAIRVRVDEAWLTADARRLVSHSTAGDRVACRGLRAGARDLLPMVRSGGGASRTFSAGCGRRWSAQCGFRRARRFVRFPVVGFFVGPRTG